MPLPIEDYAMISDCHSAALVGRDGSIDWLCLPRIDSPSTFGALLGDKDQGRWLIRPVDTSATSTREYLTDTFVLVTRWTTPTGEVEVTDFMPTGDRTANLVRRMRGVSGSVDMWQDLRIRFGYAAAMPWVQKIGENRDQLLAIAGPDALIVQGRRLYPTDHAHGDEFTISAGETVDMQMTWFRSHRPPRPAVDVDKALSDTIDWWRRWSENCTHAGPHEPMVRRSLLILRALTNEDTGGIVAAATMSLPEDFGGVRNWDYRYVWLRDASLTLSVLLDHGFLDEAAHWQGWLLRAIAGDPGDVQIMYGVAGERFLPEWEVRTLPGYLGAAPVRAGNGAVDQYQADVIGEVMIALYKARKAGLPPTREAWALQRALLDFTTANIDRPDTGIWEIRSEERFFTHSRVMIWAALDRAIRTVEEFGEKGPVDDWRACRDAIAAEIEERGFDHERGTYVQCYDSAEVDASLLQLPQVGYLAADDPRMLGTVAAIEQDLLRDGLLLRYRTESGVDGLPAGEFPFLACSFWLVEQYARTGRTDEAETLLKRLLSFANDVGMFSEEYDVQGARQAGNTPQALSHLAMVRAADALAP